jgi:hypothetical protein
MWIYLRFDWRPSRSETKQFSIGHSQDVKIFWISKISRWQYMATRKRSNLLISLALLTALDQFPLISCHFCCSLITPYPTIFSLFCQFWFQIYFEPRSQSSGDDALQSHSLKCFIVWIPFPDTSLRPFRSSINDVKIESDEKCHQPIIELTTVSPIERGLSKFCGIVPAYWNFLRSHWNFTA